MLALALPKLLDRKGIDEAVHDRAGVLSGPILLSGARPTGIWLPTFLPGLQDSFVSPPHTGVTWFSWLRLAASMSAGVIFGFAGIGAIRRQRTDAPPR